MGGSLALWSGALADEVKVAVGFYPAIPWEKMSPTWGNYTNKSAMIHASEEDGTSKADGVQAAVQGIQEAGGDVEVYDYPGSSHAFFNDQRPEVHDKEHSERPGAAPWTCSRAASDRLRAGRPGHRVAGRPGRLPYAGRADPRRRTPAGGGRRIAARARRRGVGVPGLPAAGGLARAGGGREAALVRRRAVLGPADRRLGRRRARGAGRRASRRRLTAATAPAAMFTGDRSGDWLFAALHRAGLATQPTSTHADDGQRLVGTRMLAAVRCAPPANAPTPAERDTCAPWLDAEVAAVLPHLRVVVALGAFAWQALLGCLGRLGSTCRDRGRGSATAPRCERRRASLVVGCFHPSQQNTFTGRLTEPMLDQVLDRAVSAARAARLRSDHGDHDSGRDASAPASSSSAAGTSACTRPCGCRRSCGASSRPSGSRSSSSTRGPT